ALDDRVVVVGEARLGDVSGGEAALEAVALRDPNRVPGGRKHEPGVVAGGDEELPLVSLRQELDPGAIALDEDAHARLGRRGARLLAGDSEEELGLRPGGPDAVGARQERVHVL